MYRIDGIDSALVEKVCSALKKKWMDGNQTVDMHAMCKFYKITSEVAMKIISWYESQLIATKFTVI